MIDHSDGTGLSRAYDVLRGGNEGLLVAFFGDLDEEQATVAAKMRQRSGGAVAFVLDSETWAREPADVPGPLDRSEERLRMLREAGWTAVSVPRAPPWRRCGARRTTNAPASRRRAAGRARDERKARPARCTGRRPGPDDPRGRRTTSTPDRRTTRTPAPRRSRAGRARDERRARLALCAWAATLMAACALLPLVDPATWILQAALLLAVQSAVGAAARRVPLARPLTIAAQAVVTLVLLTLVFARQHALAGLIPGPQAFQRFADLLQQGGDDIARYAIPAPLESDGIRLMLIGGVLVIGLLVDTSR